MSHYDRPVRSATDGVTITVLLLALSAGCSRSIPTAPTANTGIFPTGLYLLSVGGGDVSSDPALPACSAIGVPREGKSVTVNVRLAPAGAGWEAQSIPPGLTLDLQRSDAAGLGVARVVGTLRGSAWDEGIFSVPATDVGVTISGTATLFGTVSSEAVFSGGDVFGAFTFADHANHSSSCTAGTWSLTHASTL